MQTSYPISKTQSALLAEKQARVDLMQADLTNAVSVILAGHDLVGQWKAIHFGPTDTGHVLTIETPDPDPVVDQGEGPEG